jgi:DNA-binding PadR family transcriptional regulator
LSSPDANIRLTPASYIVLGYISLLGGEATPYDIKRMLLDTGIGHFWPFPHSQLYAEPDRLAQAGYVSVRREEDGRRRKIYTLTREGRSALLQWRAEPVHELFELRDMFIIKLFFGADPSVLVHDQLEVIRRALRRVEESKERYAAVAPPGPLLVGDYVIAILRAQLAFWSERARGR